LSSDLLALVSILALGIGAQWLAWRIKIPAILLLLAAGVIAGPVTGLVDPDALFGDMLFAGVSLAVAVILFEGGLTLRMSELERTGGAAVVWRLCSVGALTTWALAAAGAYWIVGLPTELAVLLGAVLVVTGPTVIGPLLRQLQVIDRVGSVLKWEGILIDPIGAILAVLVFEVIIAAAPADATSLALFGLLRSALAGIAVGAAGAGLLIFLLRNYYVPDYLQSPVSLTAVGATLVASNALQHESGILAVTVMGLALGAQRWVPVRHILEFKENLRVLFISTLFITLAARLELAELQAVAASGSVYLASLVLIVRPICVVVSTLGSKLTWTERAVLMAMAPRGIVAAAVVSVFAIELVAHDVPGAASLVPLTFFIIAGTIVIYALLTPPLARRLGVTKAPAQGVLFFGASRWARAAAAALLAEGVNVLVVDDVYRNIRRARMEELPTRYGSPMSEVFKESLDLDGIGKLAAVTSNDQANSLAALNYGETFGRSEVYQLAFEGEAAPGLDRAVPMHLRGRLLFGDDMSYGTLSDRMAAGGRVKVTRLSESFGMDEHRRIYGETAVALFLIREDGSVLVFATDRAPEPKAGDRIVCLVDAEHADVTQQ